MGKDHVGLFLLIPYPVDDLLFASYLLTTPSSSCYDISNLILFITCPSAYF